MGIRQFIIVEWGGLNIANLLAIVVIKIDNTNNLACQHFNRTFDKTFLHMPISS